MRYIGSVSYTHLDVYKRQTLTNVDLDKIFKSQQDVVTNKQIEIDKLYYQLHPIKRLKRKLKNR